ncbi:unnamed protein product, partial [Mesorhabditis spiculigera]
MIPGIFPLLLRLIQSNPAEIHPPTLNLTHQCVDSECDRMHDLTETGGLLACFGQNVENIYQYGPTIFPVRQTTIYGGTSQSVTTTIHCSQYQLKMTMSGDRFEDVSQPNGYCPTTQDDSCDECPIGSRPTHPGPTYQEACELVQIALGYRYKPRYPFYIKKQSNAWLIAHSADPQCPAGTYQGDFDKDEGVRCDKKCPRNCIKCYAAKMCLQCEAGFLPALAADGSIRFCVGGTELIGDSRMASTCPGGYIRTGDLCWACRDLFPKCVGCDREGRCIQCERGYIPIHGHYRVTCVRLCTSLGCLECATGLYSMHQHIQDNTVICRYSCPLHYYPLNYFPFRCEPCHPSCWGCRGPTDRDCLDCKTVGFWDMRALKCDSSMNRNILNAQDLKNLRGAREEVENIYDRSNLRIGFTRTGAAMFARRYNRIVQEAALRELEYLVFLRKTRTGSSSSFGPTSPPQARSSDTVPAVPSSSSNSKKALGPLAEPKPRVIVRPNLRTQARLNMRLKRNLELRKEEAKKQKAKSKSRSKSLSLGTTQESHQGTLDAKSFSRETGTGERTGTRTTMYTTEHSATVATTMRTVEQPAPATPHTSERRTTSAAEIGAQTPCPSSTDLGSHSAPALATSTSGDVSPPNPNRSHNSSA